MTVMAERTMARMGSRKALNVTHTLLLAYAKSTSSLTVAGTVRQFTDWYNFLHGVRISERTFQRHTRQLTDAGVISVRHTARRTWYTLLVDEIEVPTYKLLPTPDPRVSNWVQDGTEIIRYAPPPAVAVVRAHDDVDLDALQASWVNAGSYSRPFSVIAA